MSKRIFAALVSVTPLLLVGCVSVSLIGCATRDMITTVNTVKALSAVTAESVRAELITGSHYAR